MNFNFIPNPNPTFATVKVSSLTPTHVVFAGADGLLSESANMTFADNATATLSEVLCAGNLSSGAYVKLPKSTSSVGAIAQWDGVAYRKIFHTYVPSNQSPTWPNVFIGSFAGSFNLNNTTLAYNGTGNVGIGAYALAELTTGFYNFGIGTGSGQYITTGAYNTLIGHQSGQYIVDGASNLCLGTYTGLGLTSGSRNVFIGYRTARYGNGSDSICIGTESGLSSGTNSHSKNVLVGSYCGYSVTTGSSNIFFGYKAGYYQSTNSNLFIVDNQGRGSAGSPTDSTKALIYGVMNATETNQTLQVNATLGVTGLSTLTGGIAFPASANIALATTTGTKIGTATNQLLGFYNATPVDQPAAVADATGSGDVVAQFNSLLANIRELGLIAT